MKKLIKILDDGIVDLRHKAQTEEKGNWLSVLLVIVLILVFSVQFLIFEPLIAGLVAFVLVIALTYGFVFIIIKREIK